MRKYKKALKEIRDHLGYISSIRIDMIYMEEQLKQAINKVGQVIKKHEFDTEILQIRSWFGELEAKISNNWYTHTGLYRKIRAEIASQITQNMNDILEIKEALQK